MVKLLRVSYTELIGDEYDRLIDWLGNQALNYEFDGTRSWVIVHDVTEADMKSMESVLRG